MAMTEAGVPFEFIVAQGAALVKIGGDLSDEEKEQIIAMRWQKQQQQQQPQQQPQPQQQQPPQTDSEQQKTPTRSKHSKATRAAYGTTVFNGKGRARSSDWPAPPGDPTRRIQIAPGKFMTKEEWESRNPNYYRRKRKAAEAAEAAAEDAQVPTPPADTDSDAEIAARVHRTVNHSLRNRTKKRKKTKTTYCRSTEPLDDRMELAKDTTVIVRWGMPGGTESALYPATVGERLGPRRFRVRYAATEHRDKVEQPWIWFSDPLTKSKSVPGAMTGSVTDYGNDKTQCGDDANDGARGDIIIVK